MFSLGFIVGIETLACGVNICVKPDKQLVREEAELQSHLELVEL